MTDIERMLRAAAPSALAILVRRTRDFEASEDAMQEALLAASVQWRSDPPDNPRAWLVTVAHRRHVEQVRSDVARRRREESVFEAPPDLVPSRDDSLTLFLLCCHPSLALPAQLALTLRAVGGLTTAEIARGLLVPEATIGQRISRAKARIRASGSEFRMPSDAELGDRVGAVCSVLYLVFTEGHTATGGESLTRVDLSSEAIRLARQLQDATPADAPWRGEVAGLLALMLLTECRRGARIRFEVDGGPGTLVPLAEQDRSLWDRALIDEGVALVSGALESAPAGPYQLQAAIAAVHDEAPSTAETDWPEILGLYELLRRIAPGPMVELNWVVAMAMVWGAAVGLRELETVALEPALAGHFRVHSVRGHLLELSGETDAARSEFAMAARLALNAAERRYLEGKAA
ncbi:MULTISPECIES: RNA polymerase sigma factor [unclassified Leifsonia]|uniref:RNA polymerase sigma factor n=1 Tax=unclassified Leifsonia TaxID=2663824 RepID=UPI0006FC09E4|nr:MULTISPECIES: DUF6596 domain-containing protein [unclassified Leifsonia]KQX08241.1 RNA polymerase subunit sigma-24 [Leifsonia sp. Root1293]KRA12523.1 RNA polymerase subunit sigma-24 [Leifsonia sp. Root60]